jgi:2-polyprenyl-3-methyl-5-hydroxy-6-metoxy-1,4-benzoquinol methylase
MFDLKSFVDPENQSKKLIISNDFLENEIKTSRYKIINDIPRFTGNDYATNFGDQWTEYDKDQFDDQPGDYEHLKRSYDVLQEAFPHELEEMKDKFVLEAGSGNGRFTHVMLNNGAKVDTFDLSHSVDTLKKNIQNHKNFKTGLRSIAQANILKMPYRKEFYDYVICVHVLQHTPNPEESIKKLWEMVKPGGYLVIDHYRTFWKTMYPPIGGFGNVFRKITLCLPYERQKNFSDSFVKFWFPIHWAFKDSKLMQHVLLRMSPVRFYYPWLKLKTREAYFRKALVDTHDGSTDRYHHFRTVNQIKKSLMKLDNIAEFSASKGGNGVVAWANKK